MSTNSQARSIDWCMIFCSALIVAGDISEANRIHFFETPFITVVGIGDGQ